MFYLSINLYFQKKPFDLQNEYTVYHRNSVHQVCKPKNTLYWFVHYINSKNTLKRPFFKTLTQKINSTLQSKIKKLYLIFMTFTQRV